MNNINTYQNAILNDNSLNLKDKDHLLIRTSITSSSLSYWFQEYVKPASSRTPLLQTNDKGYLGLLVVGLADGVGYQFVEQGLADLFWADDDDRAFTGIAATIVGLGISTWTLVGWWGR